MQRQLRDLVEEQRPAMRGLEEALPILGGAGESALAVAEKLAFHERLGNGAAVHRHERVSRRAPFSWIRRAASSLPLPDSPEM